MNENVKKYAGAITRVLASQIPIVGPLAVELANVTIPHQRQERIEKLLNTLSSKVFDISEEQLKEKFNSTDFIDIFEDVLLQSVRATSDERLEYLAAVLKKGLTDEEFDHLKTKRLLEIFAKINDVEVLILQSYALEDSNREFKQKHKNIFELKDIVITHRKNLSESDKEKKALLEHYDDNLITLGLIGNINTRILSTRLGTQLLELIGLSVELDFLAYPTNPLDVRQELKSESKNILKKIEDTKKQAIQEINQELRKIESVIRRYGR